MGTDKALLPCKDGLNFAEFLINAYLESGFEPVIMVANQRFIIPDQRNEKVTYVINEQVELGRNHSIQLGLRQILPGQACFLQNVDNPFVESGLLGKLADSLQPDGYVVPVHKGKGGHPILLGHEVSKYLREMKNMNNLREALIIFQRTEIPFPDERIHWNINTPEDYEHFRKQI
jgi:CTP:molybdopterin cytidylyltransferase MocA